MNEYKSRQHPEYIFREDDSATICTLDEITAAALLVCKGNPIKAAAFMRRHGAAQDTTTAAAVDQLEACCDLAKATNSARIQHAALFMRLAAGGNWGLYCWPGSLNGVALFEAAEAPNYPPLLGNVEAMTADTLATKLNAIFKA